MFVIPALEALPTEGTTVSALRALDFAVPGTWTNPTRIEAMLEEVGGVSSPNVLAILRQRVVTLDVTNTSHTAEALKVYALVDRLDQAAAGAAVASKLTDLLGGLGGLGNVVPKPQTVQAVDAGLKLVAELVAFGLLNGFPKADRDGIARFTGALTDYARYDLLRVAAWVLFDGLLPLGPGFVKTLSGTFSSLASDELVANPVFKALADRLPGGTAADKRDFALQTVNRTGDWIDGFVTERGLTQDKAVAALKGVLPGAALGAEAMAAAIDASTSIFQHTGTQTVARALARQAVDGMRDEVWGNWVRSVG